MITLYDETHAAECAVLFREVFAAPPFGFKWMAHENVMRYFSDLYRTPHFTGFVYREAPAAPIAGACFGVGNDYFASHLYDIKEIFVRLGSQGHGRGTLMLKEIEAALAARGVRAITLATQRSMRAYEFYIKNGFSPSENTVYMSKLLE